MILSVHMPKAAGNTFAQALEASFGSRMLRDYGDAAGYDEAVWNARRDKRKAAARAQRDQLLEKYDIIHGHFVADKYAGLFPTEHYSAFFRHPFQQVLSHYEFLMRSTHIKNPIVGKIHETKMSFMEYLKWQETANPQTQFLGSVPLEDFAVVGLAEEFDRGVALFNATLGCNIAVRESVNVNPERQGRGYEMDEETRKAIETYRAADLDLYHRAEEIFRRRAALKDV